MTILEQLKSNFPNIINKGKEVFAAFIGSFNVVLIDVENFIKEWVGTTDVYKQSGEMLSVTSKFFSYFERYTDESEEAFKKRIQTIFIRNNDNQWGGPYDVINVFRSYFPSAKIFLVENVDDVENNVLIDGDFQTKDEAWKHVDDNPSSTCHFTRDARFSKSFGVEIKNNGYFYQEFEPDVTSSNYLAIQDDTFTHIAKLKYGDIEKASYIAENNPTVIEPIPLNTEISIPALNVYFLHFFMTGYLGVQIIDTDTGKYWNPSVTFDRATGKWTCGSWQTSEKTIDFNTSDQGMTGEKAVVNVTFSRESTAITDFRIPIGTVVSDGTHEFKTTKEAVISAGQTESNSVKAEASDIGWEYNVDAESIDTIISEFPFELSVTNPDKAGGGCDFGWDNKSLFFIGDKDVSSIRIKFVGKSESNAYVDYIRLFKKASYPSFSIIAQFSNFADQDAAALFPGHEDESITTAVENASYYDNDFLSGVYNGGYAKDLYNDLLEYVKVVGVKAYIEIINKDE